MSTAESLPVQAPATARTGPPRVPPRAEPPRPSSTRRSLGARHLPHSAPPRARSAALPLAPPRGAPEPYEASGWATVLAVLAPLTLAIALLWPHAERAPLPTFARLPHAPIASLAALAAPELRLPTGPAAPCGADIVVADALVDPDDRPDREGEEITLLNREPVALDLDGFVLAAGRRRLVLPSLVVPAGEAVVLGGAADRPTLGTLRLTNRGGSVVLSDPCGVVRSCLRWGGEAPPPAPGWRVHAPGPNEESPARSVTGGASSGCGQT